jgi:hypothetical protein
MTKLIVTLLVAAALVVPLGIAQTPNLPAESKKTSGTPEPVIVPFCVGTVFNAILVTPLDARRNKAGDPVIAEVSEEVSYERSVIFPKGTKIYGHLVRASSARSGKGSALFVVFEKAVLKNGQDVMMNAGIQALIAGRAPVPSYSEPAFEDAPLRGPSFPSAQSPESDYPSRDVSRPSVVPASQDLRPQVVSRDAGLPAAQGGMTKSGMLTPDSQGALGASDMKVYTPLSEGSDGTVILSAVKNVHLDAGTKLLIVIQPPPETDPSLQ